MFNKKGISPLIATVLILGFTVAVIPPKDQYERKEVVAITDSGIIKGGFLRMPIKDPKEILVKFTEWGGTGENVNRLSDFLNDNLKKKEIKKKKSSYGGKVTSQGVSGKYSKEEEYK